MQSHIIKLSTSTKVLYSLFNFFAPIASVVAFIYASKASGTASTLALMSSIVVGTVCLLWKWEKYKQFLLIKDNTLFVCRGEVTAPKILERIQVEGNDVAWSGTLSLDYNGKRIKLLDAYASWIGILCVIGKFVWIPMLLGYMMQLYFVSELYKTFPQLFSRAPKNVTRNTVIAFSVLMWLFTIYVGFVGIVGLLLRFAGRL